MTPFQVIERIRDQGKARIYLACTGAGAGLQNLLWEVPGISSVFVGASFPYERESAQDFLHFDPGTYCSPTMAVALAMESFYRAIKDGGVGPIGIGLTASVASTQPHRGDHRIFGAWFSDRGCEVRSTIVPKGFGLQDRLRDGRTADLIGLSLLRSAVGFPGPSPARSSEMLIDEEIDTVSDSIDDGDSIAREIFFKRPFFRADGSRQADPAGQSLTLFPGSFNPPHEGHFGMADEVQRRFKKPVIFAIEATPPHKPIPSVASLLRRAKALKGREVLFTAGDPLFLDKARQYPNSEFIVGADTLIRMCDPKWSNDPKWTGSLTWQQRFEYNTMLGDEFRRAGAKFLLFGRKVNGEEIDLAKAVQMPPNFPHEYIKHEGWDISSSEIRARAEALKSP